MSPEQATGDRNIDRRTDVYSLGAIAYEMLAGEPPHLGTTAQAIIARVLTEVPRSTRVIRPNVPEHVDAAVIRALEKLPADRFASAQELADAITGKAVAAATTATRAAGKTAPRWQVFVWPGVAVASLAVAAWMTVKANRPAPALVAAEFTVELPDSLSPAIAAGVPQVAISRDGSRLVFRAARPGGPPALYVRRLGDRTVQIIGGTDSATGRPSLSPDGEEVVFAAGGAVKRISLRGGTARTVAADAGYDPSWGDAGSIVYYASSGLRIVPEDGGPHRVLAAPDSSRRHVRYFVPNILPGGKAAVIAISNGAAINDSITLGTVTIPGGEVTELGIRGTYPRYSATGHLLYVTVDNDLFAVPFSARSLRVEGQPFLVAEGVRLGTGGGAAFAVSANGTLAYLGGGGEASEGGVLVAVSRSGAERTLDVRPGVYQSPRVSPDGKQIAFTMYSGPRRISGSHIYADIWRVDRQSRAMSRVTTDSASYRPAWSADGQRIAYTKPEGDSVVMWRPLYASGQATPLVRSALNIVAVSIGPAHGYVAMQISGGENNSDDIVIAHSDSLLPPRPLLAEPYGEFSPRISPDGRLIAYVTNRTGRNEVYVRALQGSGPEVPVSIDGGNEPVWARNSRELFFRGPSHLMSARLADGPRLAIARRDALFRGDTYVRGGPANYDVFPDGNEFVMLRSNLSSARATEIPLIVVLNWVARRDAQASGRGQ
jgi:serine/threonine-protein kinase